MMNASPNRLRKARILVVDGHSLLRAGLIHLINRQSDLRCCGEADSVGAAPNAIATRKPDLMLTGLVFRDGDGIAMIKSLKSQFPDLPILVLSQHDETVYAEKAWQAGAAGYVLKQEAPEEVLLGIRTCLKKETYVSRATSVLVLRRLLENKPAIRNAGIENLTDRELQVFQLLGAGLATRQVATELNLSFKTIETYRENLKHKLGLRDAPNLIRFAIAWAEGQGQTSSETAIPVGRKFNADGSRPS